MSSYIKSSGNQHYLIYKQGKPYVYTGNNIIPLAEYCEPLLYMTNWQNFDNHCNNSLNIQSSVPLETTWWIPPNISSVPAKNLYDLDNADLDLPRNLLCGTPPQVNMSTAIRVFITDDDFYGIYIFNFNNITLTWELNTDLSYIPNLSVYPDSTSSYYNKYLVNLVETRPGLSNWPYQGYIEYSHDTSLLDNNMSIKEDAYAFPCRFVFSAIKHPSDVGDELNTSPDTNTFPTGVGKRLVSGFKMPMQWRVPYKDFTLNTQIGHSFTGPASNYVSGYAEQGDKPYDGNINISGISDNPYYLYDTSTATTPVCTGITEGGFAYKVEVTGFGFSNSQLSSTNMANRYAELLEMYLSQAPEFEKKVYNGYTYDPTPATSNEKQNVTAVWSLLYSCDKPITDLCLDYIDPVVDTNDIKVISDISCFGSTTDIDWWCSENIAKPTAAEFQAEGITKIIPVYSGVSGLRPIIKHSAYSIPSGLLYPDAETDIVSLKSIYEDATENIDGRLRLLGEVTDINRGTFANVYSSTNVRNTTVWTNKISPVDITCVSTHKTGGVLISPRHTLHCAHLGWYPKANDIMNFVKSDNTVVSATVLSSAAIEGFINEYPYPYDMVVTYLDIDVESSGIPACKVLPDDYQNYLSPIVYEQATDIPIRIAASGQYSIPIMCLQNNEDVLSVNNLIYLNKDINQSDYGPKYSTSNSNAQLRTKFTYSLDSGDSGSPIFLIIDNQLVLVGTITNPHGGGTALIEEVKTRVESRMNSLAAAQNDNTSYSLTPIDLSDADLSTIFYRNESNELDPELFRQWLNSNVSFAKYDGSLSDPAQTIGIYWYSDPTGPTPTTIYARLFPDYSNKVADYGLIIEDAESTFNGKYNWNSNSNRWILSTNPNVQMRCSNNNWILGVLDGATYTTYYSLISVSSEYSLLPTINGSSDAFQEVYTSSIYTCQSIPLGTWSKDGYIGANLLITSQLGEIYQ